MHMHDWNNYRNQLSAAVTGFGKLSPETVKGCTAFHTAAARKHGGTGKDETAEALGVAVSINSGAALVYSVRTLDAFEAVSEEQAST